MMARDALDVLVRLRDMAVTEASTKLTAARGDETKEAMALDGHRLSVQREKNDARGGDMTAFVAWLPRALAEEQRLLASVQAASMRVERCQQILLECRTDAEAVEKVRTKRREVAALLVARREQAEMDEVAGRTRSVWTKLGV
jgi:flagellar export protein FliJ